MTLRADDLKKNILKMARRGEFYGYEMRGKLEQANKSAGLSRLYRVLNEMATDELLQVRWAKGEAGPRRKVYRVSEKGEETLESILLEAIATVHDFYTDYLRSLHPRIAVFDKMFEFFMRGLESVENLCYVASSDSPMHRIVIHHIKEKIAPEHFYLVQPKSSTANLDMDGIIKIQGYYDKIHLRDDHFDAVLTTGLPPRRNIDRALFETNRVLKPNGVYGVFLPSILIQEYVDPITIGQFIEKYEHTVLERGEHWNRNEIFSKIKDVRDRAYNGSQGAGT
jgi:DNA-binding PadR family transcriptional regulator